ncbi:hypothetical protein [Streptomyces sp. NL15-2K]|uniref:hypothetical protein n=1 Tax=Streptomyces sp. NL15-2K TaxID=376149 RepID=UPI00155A1001|nr:MULTISPECIES: hypothetical protein [Actinomycetes]WKX11214.1 hypothetical protein Q4V64_28340 [Kutzneria buriramensis]
MLVAAFSAVVAFGTVNGLSAAKGDTPADDVTSVTVVAAPAAEEAPLAPGDSVWD